MTRQVISFDNFMAIKPAPVRRLAAMQQWGLQGSNNRAGIKKSMGEDNRIRAPLLMQHESPVAASGWLVGLLFLVAGLTAYTLPAMDFFRAVPGDLGDARFNSVVLEHLYAWCVGKEPSLWSPRYFYPFENILGFSDNHFGSGAVYVVARLLGASREIGYDVWYLVGMVLNFLAMFIAMRMLKFGALASVVAAFVFTFSLPVLHMGNHGQLNYRFAIPLALAHFLRAVDQANGRDLVLAIIYVVVQFFCAIYTGFFLGLMFIALVAVMVLTAALIPRLRLLALDFRAKSAAYQSAWLLALALSVSALALMMAKYWLIQKAYDIQQPLEQFAIFMPTLKAYLMPDSALFPGFGVLLLVAGGLLTAKSDRASAPLARVCFLTFLVLFVLTTSVYGPSLYMSLIGLPGFSAIRVVNRIILIMLLPLSVIAAVFVQRLEQRAAMTGTLASIALPVALLLVVLPEVILYQPLRTPIAEWQAREHSVLTRVPEDIAQDSVLMVNGREDEDRFLRIELDGMIAAQTLGIATLNGYSGSFPPGWSAARVCVAPVNRLLGYANFHGLPRSSIEGIAARVIEVQLGDCPHEPRIGFYGKVDPEIISHLSLKVLDAEVRETTVAGHLQVTNTSTQTLYTYTLSGQPVRLSWRLVSPSLAETSLSQPTWDPNRLELTGWQLGASQSRILAFEVPLTAPLPVRLEFSMVQDLVYWFHNLGMVPAAVLLE